MSPDAIIMHARNRHDALLREAGHERLVQAARNDRADPHGSSSQVSIAWRLVGVRLERWGCWLRGCIPSCTCALRTG